MTAGASEPAQAGNVIRFPKGHASTDCRMAAAVYLEMAQALLVQGKLADAAEFQAKARGFEEEADQRWGRR
ncbi:hypothetical protein [Siccirubricoccus phaeus]|uniref:hypothetical protein n=1 Tax=Siccirubricoccus phaeus TaxID=2595053 RepID=UPI0011F0C26A|nr:hypothetical protein [Siccirubricoccus phaeus]